MPQESTASARLIMARNILRFQTPESEENEFENSSTLSTLSPSRAPLNSIPDPSQLQKVNHGSDFNLVQKFEGARAQHHRTLGPEKRAEVNAMHESTHRIVGRNAKARSEPNSAPSTPARSGARLSLGGGARVVQPVGGRGMSLSCRIPRAISVADSVISAEVAHFELNEDPSFWKEHNVQVLIRIRPLSSMEKGYQGYGRCLKQESPHTLVWLGHPDTRFTFDHVACETISQEKLFRVAGMPMVENCLSGYNSCMFAYGQTGSGKTYTMMGEISELEDSLNNHCGITPRIFEYLFSRIKMEEEGRRDERLKFSCKCSFLEIYNEQITDLLEPSSTNLQLREDLVKGVYVENLVEHNVRNVDDVLKLLLQGAANRKIAATRMNSESSRSHCVLTCTIESRWERDSLTHFRFARLNLVDLAGSERQKSSGAEGDRLKEAANINKSLSTLGLVIMSLVDLAHGKHRHVPYRDSRLTFLLQDSLGGNSKTMIIANVSPSLCSANETLSTLKFAQRAKLIQNNAKVNEDASGDVTALQQEIRKLKGQLSSFMKNQKKSSKAVSDCLASLKGCRYCGISEMSGDLLQDGCHCQMHSSLSKKVKSMKKILTGALRREKIAETALQKSKAEIEQLNSWAKHREEDAKCAKISSPEEKVKQLEMMMSGSLTSQEYIMEENKALKGEIQLLQESMDRNVELTHSALENIRLREQLQVYQNFSELGERETLLAEISELRDQLLDVLEAKDESFSGCVRKDNKVEKELENCKKMNSNLIRELEVIRGGLGRCLNFDQTAPDFVTSSDKDQYYGPLAETMSITSDCREDTVCYAQEKEIFESNRWSDLNGESNNDHNDIRKELMEARSFIEAMEAEQVRLIDELQVIQEENGRYRKILSKNDSFGRESFPKVEAYDIGLSGLDLKKKEASTGTGGGVDKYVLQFKLEKLSKDLEEARTLNGQYEKEHKLQLSQQRDIELVHEQVETETASTILHLQEEVIALQSEFQERICILTQETQALKDTITAREAEIRTLNQDWEKATIELTSFIVDGSKSIKDASTQIESIICSFPHVNAWIGDYVEKAAKVCLEKEETVLFLQKSLEDARILLAEMDLKLKSLKGATIALNEARLQDNVASIASIKEAFRLSTGTDKMSNVADMPDSEFESKQHQILEAERRAETALAVMKWLTNSLEVSGTVDTDSNTCRPDLVAAIDGRSKLPYEKSNDNLSTDNDTNGIVEASNMIYQGGPEYGGQEMHNRAMSLASVKDLGNCVYSEEGQQSGLVPLTLTMEREQMECKFSNTPYSEVYAGLIQRMDPARSFFKEFEAVNATMKEADLTLRQLVEANEKSKHVTGVWRQTGEEVMVERTSLIEDLERLRSSVSLCEKENQLLLNQTHSTLVDMTNSMSLLEDNFQQMQRGVEETLEVLYSDVLLIGRELLHLIANSRPSLEQVFSETMERGFALYVIYQCHIGKLIDQILDRSKTTVTPNTRQEKQLFMESYTIGSTAEDNASGQLDRANRADGVTGLENGVVVNNLIYENLTLKNELERKEALFEGLLFDFRLLQESASNKRDIKDETDELIDALCQVRQKLERKTIQVDDLIVQKEKLETCLSDLQKAMFMSKSDLEQAEERIHTLKEQNDELRALVKDLCLKKTTAEEALDEQRELVKGLESEILHLTNTAEMQVLSSVRTTEEDLRKVTGEKEQLLDIIRSLNDKLEMAYAIADEKEAIAVEAHQESETSKIYAEQKEEEVKILEISVEELERTVNVLERRVYDMEEEVERHRMIRNSLETELQALRQRLLRVENFNIGTEECEGQISRSKELQEAHDQVEVLEKEVAELNKEIKQLREYNSEVLLHSEAQASGYQEKYMTLAAMVQDLKLDASSSSAAATTSHKTEKSSTRSRGSGSPFRCIAGLVQQMNLEKDQELSTARLRIEELESSLADKQKEVCSLNTRIAAADSMAHDVIRDLLGVKMDMTNYANLVDRYQLQRVVEESHQRLEEIMSKEQEIFKLKKLIAALVEERESCISELKKKEADVLATEINLEQLQERVGLLSAQNDMLKNDKTNLLRKVAEVDQTDNTRIDAEGGRQCVAQTPRGTMSIKLVDTDYSKRLEKAQKLLSNANNELAKYRKTSNNQPANNKSRFR